MIIRSWDGSLVGVDPSGSAPPVLVVLGANPVAGPAMVDRLGCRGRKPTVAGHAARRALTPVLPGVAVVSRREQGRVPALLGRAGTHAWQPDSWSSA